VEVHGSFNNWGPGTLLAPSDSDPGIYEGAIDVFAASGSQVQYKFVINQTGSLFWEGNVGPGGPNGNRTLTLVAGSQELPVVYFNNLTNNPGAGISIESTLFTVTLSWTPGLLICLQSTTSMTNRVWDDVPNTLGQASAVLVNDTFVAGAMFFRLTGP